MCGIDRHAHMRMSFFLGWNVFHAVLCVCGIKAETLNVCTCFSASLNAIVTVYMDSDPRTFAVWLHATVKIRVAWMMCRCRAVPTMRKVLYVTQCLVVMVDVDLGRGP
jgi:hypothetical protein